MKEMLFGLLLFFLACICSFSQKTMHVSTLGELFDTVQKAQVFADQKTFADLTIKTPFTPDKVLRQYYAEKNNNEFNLKAFIARHFDTVFADTSDVLRHINRLWDYLARQADTGKKVSTLIPLKHNYIVPGGRFREVYYWDTYFTMLGLEVAGKNHLIKSMLDNFADLIAQYGHIPNGNRSYYLSRSQPPFFSLMIELYANMPETNKAEVYNTYRKALLTEYNFWMKYASELGSDSICRNRVVLVNNNQVLNRYWDNKQTPRPESYVHDIETKNKSGRGDEIYTDLRAAAESGWDFSSRWMHPYHKLGAIRTTHIIPLDLNCLLYHQELLLSCMYKNDSAAVFVQAAETRRKLVGDLLWSADTGFFFDYDFTQDKHTGVYSLAALYPLFFNMVDTLSAMRVAAVIKQNFLHAGGLVTTLNNTGEQWDYPNGWPPLHYIAYKALKNYGLNKLANEIAQRWINLNVKVFFSEHKMMEKYDVVNTNRKGGGGEYPLQDGFGWTNGVFLKLWDELHSYQP